MSGDEGRPTANRTPCYGGLHFYVAGDPSCYCGQRSSLHFDTSALADEIAHLRAAHVRLSQERDQLQVELQRWQVCENCGEKLTGPGICDRAISEREKGLELMHEETLTRAEAAEHALAECRQQLVALLGRQTPTEYTLRSSVDAAWLKNLSLQKRLEASDATLAVLTQEREALRQERNEWRGHYEGLRDWAEQNHWLDKALRQIDALPKTQIQAEAEALRHRLQALAQRWREDNSPIHRKYTDAGTAWLSCADELTAALQAPAPSQEPT